MPITPAALSPREKEIMRLIATGATKAAVAESLGISFHTVDNHLRRVYLKTGAHSRTEASVKLCLDDPRQFTFLLSA
jgi:DNA-binding CsgD family transcriptional regulator